MEKETIFFAVFKSLNIEADRMQIFTKEKTKKEFFDWVQEHKKTLEYKYNKTFVVINCKIL